MSIEMGETWGPNCVAPSALCMLGPVLPSQLFRHPRKVSPVHVLPQPQWSKKVLAEVQVGRTAQEAVASCGRTPPALPDGRLAAVPCSSNLPAEMRAQPSPHPGQAANSMLCPTGKGESICPCASCPDKPC